MRPLITQRILSVLLALTGCGSAVPTHRTDPDSTVAANENSTTSSPPAAELQRRAIEALRQVLPDQASVRYSNVRSGSGNSVCGAVTLTRTGSADAPQRLFVITPGGGAILSTAASVNFADPLDTFVDAYIRWCATPEELLAVQENLQFSVTERPAESDAGMPPQQSGVPLPEPVSRWPTSPPPEESSKADSDFYNEVRRIDR